MSTKYKITDCYRIDPFKTLFFYFHLGKKSLTLFSGTQVRSLSLLQKTVLCVLCGYQVWTEMASGEGRAHLHTFCLTVRKQSWLLSVNVLCLGKVRSWGQWVSGKRQFICYTSHGPCHSFLITGIAFQWLLIWGQGLDRDWWETLTLPGMWVDSGASSCRRSHQGARSPDCLEWTLESWLRTVECSLQRPWSGVWCVILKSGLTHDDRKKEEARQLGWQAGIFIFSFLREIMMDFFLRFLFT